MKFIKKLKFVKNIRDYKTVENQIKVTEDLLKQVNQRIKSNQAREKLKNNGLESRLNIKLDVLKQLRYDLESKSVLVRILALLRII